MNLDIIKNSHENSVRVYDSEKALPVTVENGRVISGENTISDFFESYIKGHYVSAEINGRAKKKALKSMKTVRRRSFQGTTAVLPT